MGIKNSEVRTLLCIKNLAHEGDKAITVSEISHRMYGKSPTVTQIVQKINDYLTNLFSGLIDKLGQEQSKKLLFLLDEVSNYLDQVHIDLD